MARPKHGKKEEEMVELLTQAGRDQSRARHRLRRRRIIRRSHADVLLSTGNFALRQSPVPQILLSRNSVYTSPDFYRDLLARHEYRTWLARNLTAGYGSYFEWQPPEKK